jgi:hypothetical protein
VSDDATHTPTQSLLPPPMIESASPLEPMLTRSAVINLKVALKEQRAQAARQTRGLQESTQRNALYKEIRACAEEEETLDKHLEQNFVPQHSPGQLLSPRAFSVSPLFRVCNKALQRKTQIELLLPTATGRAPMSYSGPELRQSDGRVFLALLHILRDVQVGTHVRIQPVALCKALFRRYDGNSRKLLRAHIQRLQKGLVTWGACTMQLCLSFEYPRMGGWVVALDPQIVEMFRILPSFWFPMQPRLALTDGLATWLYTYIESQTCLIPTRIDLLRQLCGCDARGRAFTNSLRLALKQVAAAGVIDTKWTLLRGEVRWLKRRDHPARS